MPETAARLRHYRTSPTKVRQVLRLIVGKDVAEAREILRFCERGPAETVMKLLDSAIANAEHNDNVPEEELYVCIPSSHWPKLAAELIAVGRANSDMQAHYRAHQAHFANA